jgi:hypothetical protein
MITMQRLSCPADQLLTIPSAPVSYEQLVALTGRQVEFEYQATRHDPETESGTYKGLMLLVEENEGWIGVHLYSRQMSDSFEIERVGYDSEFYFEGIISIKERRDVETGEGAQLATKDMERRMTYEFRFSNDTTRDLELLAVHYEGACIDALAEAERMSARSRDGEHFPTVGMRGKVRLMKDLPRNIFKANGPEEAIPYMPVGAAGLVQIFTGIPDYPAWTPLSLQNIIDQHFIDLWTDLESRDLNPEIETIFKRDPVEKETRAYNVTFNLLVMLPFKKHA